MSKYRNIIKVGFAPNEWLTDDAKDPNGPPHEIRLPDVPLGFSLGPSSRTLPPDACIFCERTAAGAPVEHILPESLGGEPWARLPSGLVCGNCNNYFGSKVEPKALASYPFSTLRVFMSIPTKKGKAPWFETSEARFTATGMPGCFDISYDSDELERTYLEGGVTSLEIPSTPNDTFAVCRLLLKMALEILAFHDPEIARHPRYDAARRFARAPRQGDTWWFMLSEATHHLRACYKVPLTPDLWLKNALLRPVPLPNGRMMFWMDLFGIQAIVPYEPDTRPIHDDVSLASMNGRVFLARC